MSRYGWMENDLDDDWMLQYGRWIARTNKVLNGKPGRAALEELERVLLAMPHKRLINGALIDTGGKPCEDGMETYRRECGVCAVGAWVYRRWVDEGMTPRDAWKKLKGLRSDRWMGTGYDEDGYEAYQRTLDVGEAALGITRTLAQIVSYENDEGFYNYQATPEDRYAHVLRWVRRALAGHVRYA